MSDVEVVISEVDNISVTVAPVQTLVIETAPVGIPGPTTYLGTLGGAGATATFVSSELLGGADANG
jgi:hypothetical protein